MLSVAPIINVAGSLLLAFVVSFSLIPAIINVVKEKNFYDMPNERAAHANKTPTLGGIAVFLSLMVTFPFFAWDADWQQVRYLVAALTVMFSIGIKDDILAISPAKKLMGQLISAILMAYFADVRISHLHGFFGIHEIPFWLSVAVSVFIYLAIVNAYNFIDGIDGLASGTGSLHAAILGSWFFLAGHYALAVLSFALVGGLMGFFYHNVYGTRYKIFMGDTGSLTLGLLMSVLAIEFNELNINPEVAWGISSAPSVTFAIMALPLFDMMRIIFVRKVLGLSVSAPDKRHLHHRLLRLGLSHRACTYWLLGFSAFFAAFGLVFQFISIRRLLLIEILLAMVLAYIPVFIYDLRKKRRKISEK